MKKKIIVIIVMIVLVLLIVLPPLFRVLVPRDEKTINNTNNETSKINSTLTCKIDTKDNYKVTFKTIYKKGKVDNISVLFKDKLKNRDVTQYSITMTQMNYFCALLGTTYSYYNSDLTVKVPKETYDQNKDDNTVKSMFQDYNSTKTYYEKIGYTCK